MEKTGMAMKKEEAGQIVKNLIGEVSKLTHWAKMEKIGRSMKKVELEVSERKEEDPMVNQEENWAKKDEGVKKEVMEDRKEIVTETMRRVEGI